VPDDAATAGAVAGAALQLSRRRQRQRQWQRQRQRECMLVGALVGRRQPSCSVFVALRVPVLLAVVRMLPGLFGAGLRLCTTSARVHTLVIVSVCMAVRYAWTFVAMEPR